MLSFLLKPFLFLFYSKKNNEVTEIRDRDIEEIEKEYVIHPYLLDNLDMNTIHKLIEDVKSEPEPGLEPENAPEFEPELEPENVPEFEPEPEPEPEPIKYTNVKKNGMSCGKNKNKKKSTKSKKNSNKRKNAKEKQKKKKRTHLEKRKQKKHKYNLRNRN